MLQPMYSQASSSSTIIPTSNPPPVQRATTLRRGKTLTRPERQVAQAPLITPPAPLAPGAKPSFPYAAPVSANTNTVNWDWWVITSLVCTFWAPVPVLEACGFKDSAVRQAWREKVTLVTICIILGGAVAFLTMGLDKALCPQSASREASELRSLGSTPGTVGIRGWVFDVSSSVNGTVDFYNIARARSGQDTTNLFTRHLRDYPSCTSNARYAKTPTCKSFSAESGQTESGTLQACPLRDLNNGTFSTLSIRNTSSQIGYSWANMQNVSNYLVIDGIVLNMNAYVAANPKPLSNDSVDTAIRTVLAQPSGGRDATRLFYNRAETREAVPCMLERYYAGKIDKITPGCFVSTLFLYVALGLIMGVILIRFAMACVFSWYLSSRMILPPKDLPRNAISPMVMPGGANRTVTEPDGAAPWRGGTIKRPTRANGGGGLAGGKGSKPSSPEADKPAPLVTQQQIGQELFTVCLITCYSENLESIKGTCDSLALTDYSDNRKLLFIVADGMVTGSGETVSTPDICVGLLEADERFGNPMPMGYVAVGGGKLKENRAMVYAGHYVAGTGRDAHRVPAIVVVKCGMPSEASAKKPGNRGKRDSQLILMNFFSRVTYNDRMTPLDFDLFRKIQVLMGVTPDFFEVCLMVDADTSVYPDSMTHLVNCMQHDKLIMGVCGETRIANKRQSWVTAIQVYEYFISHHQSKAFESVFGGVTCLPGCFSMYRLKSRKADDNDWIPIITLPDIVREYSQSEVYTLHQKNLLLLGEDRFLSTLMLRTFPNRKMMFCPQARCRTVAPDTFSVLLSQRRRWINSTIHNLMELIRVRNLCGTFCFSMQFVVFMDLVGTATLPIAICLTLALIINSIITPPSDFTSAIPLILLAAVLGLPAFLILITTGKFIYVVWMLVYLCALPIWNFVLPVYSFWHFDDFSWGETRKVEGEGKGVSHEDDKTQLVSTIPLRRWEDWERSRLRRIKREERRQKDLERMERAFNGGDTSGFDENGPRFHPRTNGNLSPGRGPSEYGGSDSSSLFSSEDDQWGAQIGGYDEDAPQFPPPPIAFNTSVHHQDGEVVDAADLDAMLEQGFDDSQPPSSHNPFAHATTSAQYNSLSSFSQTTLSDPSNSNHSSRSLIGASRFELSDDGGRSTTTTKMTSPVGYDGTPQYRAISPLSPGSEAMDSHSSAISSRSGTPSGHVKQRSVGSTQKWGLGPGDIPLIAPPPLRKY